MPPSINGEGDWEELIWIQSSLKSKAQGPGSGGSASVGHPSARRPMDPSFQKVSRLALSLPAPEGRARNERAGRGLAVTPPRTPPCLRHRLSRPGTSRGAPGAPLHLSTSRPPAGGSGASAARRPPGPEPEPGLQGHFSASLLPGAGAGAGAREAWGEEKAGRTRRRRPASPCDRCAAGRRGPPPGRGPRSPHTPPRAAARAAGATPEGAAWGGRVYTAKFPLPPRPAHPCLPPSLGGPDPAYLHARQARLHRGVSHGGQDGHFLGRDGRAAAIRAGDEVRGPRAALGRRGRPAKPSRAAAAPAGARGHPSPCGPGPGGELSGGQRATSPCTAPGRGLRGAGPRRDLPPLLLGWSRAAWARARRSPGAGVGAHRPPSPRVPSAPRAPPRPGPRARPRGPAGDPAPRFRRGRRLAAARRPRPQPPAPPPAGAAGGRSVSRGRPPPPAGGAERRGEEDGRAGGAGRGRPPGGAPREPAWSRGAAALPPAAPGPVGRPRCLGRAGAVRPNSHSTIFPLPSEPVHCSPSASEHTGSGRPPRGQSLGHGDRGEGEWPAGPWLVAGSKLPGRSLLGVWVKFPTNPRRNPTAGRPGAGNSPRFCCVNTAPLGMLGAVKPAKGGRRARPSEPRTRAGASPQGRERWGRGQEEGKTIEGNMSRLTPALPLSFGCQQKHQLRPSPFSHLFNCGRKTEGTSQYCLRKVFYLQ